MTELSSLRKRHQQSPEQDIFPLYSIPIIPSGSFNNGIRSRLRAIYPCPLGCCRLAALDAMSFPTYSFGMNPNDKPLVWLHGEIQTPPLSTAARLEAGMLLRRLQHGERLAMPHSRPMPSIGKRCHELRIVDEKGTWRVVYRLDSDAVVILEVFQKKSQRTPVSVIEACKKRLRDYDVTSEG